jgi:Tol biopolymer transport system component
MPEDSGLQVDPGWSPDGNKIVFSGAGGDPASTIRILDLQSRQISTLAGSKGLFSPRWSPNGRYVAALSSDTSRLHLFDFQAKKWTELAGGTTGGFPNWSKDGHYMYVFSDGGTRSLALTPDGSLLLLRDAGTQDVYALDWKEP